VEQPRQAILKLRPNAVWEDKAPLNKRPIDADDVVFSWKKFAALSTSRKDLVMLPDNPTGPSSAARRRTRTPSSSPPVPYAAALTRLLAVSADHAARIRWRVRPEERDLLRRPFTLANYQRSVKFEYRRANYWAAKDIFLDGYDPHHPEYAAGLAQFGQEGLTFRRTGRRHPAEEGLPDLLLDQNI
jgi:ABC-type oligopeptide transport system substrate-binding subunit